MKKLFVFLILLTCNSCSHLYKDKHLPIFHKAVVKAWKSGDEEKNFSYKWLSEDEKQQEDVNDGVDLKKKNTSTKHLQLTAINLAPGTKYDLYVANMECKRGFIGIFTVTQEGKLVSNEGIPLENLKILVPPESFMMGEPQYYVLVSREDQSTMTVMVVPDPIEMKWGDGACLSLVMFDVKNCFYAYIGQGFIPDEEFSIESKSCNETINLKKKADKNGRTFALFSPAVIGHPGGIGQMRITRQGKEQVLLYPWGVRAVQKVKTKEAERVLKTML